MAHGGDAHHIWSWRARESLSCLEVEETGKEDGQEQGASLSLII